MKTKLLLFFSILFVNFFTYSQSLEGDKNFPQVLSIEQSRDAGSVLQNTVYVCTGQYAYAYHSNPECAGLNNCQAEVNYTNESFARYNLKRKPCCRCWSNVSNDCVDDNKQSYAGGGGNSDEAMAYVAIAVVAASAAILSNDIYFYPVYSFYDGGEERNITSNEIGYAFGFRKTFRNSALEYGASLLNSTYNDEGYYYDYSYQEERWGFHLNYIHHIFYDSTPKWLDLYIGPSINSVDDFGYGGVTGVQMQIVDRLKFDLRYEYTTQTNQVQAGLIFKYQKKYFWKN